MLYSLADETREACMLYIMYPRREDSWPKKLYIYLMMWVTWIMPAFSDTAATDVGEAYQGGLAVLLSIWASVAVTYLIFGLTYFALDWQTLAEVELGLYLIAGALYHLYDWSWS